MQSQLPPTRTAVCPTHNESGSPSARGFDHPILGIGQMYGIDKPESRAGIAGLFFGLALGPGGKAAETAANYQALKVAVEKITSAQRMLQLTRQTELAQKLAPFIDGVGGLLHSNPLGWVAAKAAEKLRGAEGINQLEKERFAKLLDEVGKAYDKYIAGRAAK